MFYVAIIVYFIGWQQWKIGLGNILSHFLFLHGFRASWINTLVPGGWSVGVEMMFYVVLPILFLKIKNINHAINFFLISNTLRPFINKLLSLKIETGQFEYYWYQYLPNQMPIFCLGLIIYFLVFENRKSAPPPPHNWRSITIILKYQYFSTIIYWKSNILFWTYFIWNRIYIICLCIKSKRIQDICESSV
jgi:peptidoglycan/LPS O-acetylase OafA/YrhL